MEEKFDPKDEQYKEVADLPAGHQDEFKPVERGFVRNETIDNKNTAEHIAHIENVLREEAQEKIGIAVDDILKGMQRAKERRISEFRDNREGRKSELSRSELYPAPYIEMAQEYISLIEMFAKGDIPILDNHDLSDFLGRDRVICACCGADSMLSEQEIEKILDSKKLGLSNDSFLIDVRSSGVDRALVVRQGKSIGFIEYDKFLKDAEEYKDKHAKFQ